jgi:hypothetical protein
MAGPEGQRPQPHHIPEPQQTLHEGGNGAPGIPPSVHERAKPPPESRAFPTLPQKSALYRAVERTRDLYERNGWVFLPLGEAGKASPSLSNLKGEHSQQPDPQEQSRRRERTSYAGATLYSGVGLFDLLNRRDKKP